MCVAIYKPYGKVLTKKDLNNAWDTNPDGGGIAYRDSLHGEITIEKGFRSKKKWVKAITHLGADVEMLIHARIATHGHKSNDNTHPHRIPSGGCWIHNGMISRYPRDQQDSDTVMFTNEFLEPCLKDYPDFFLREYGRKLFAEMLNPSKGMFMLPGQPIVIINSKFCIQEDGIWYSNLHFRGQSRCTTTYPISQWNNPNYYWDAINRMYVERKPKLEIITPPEGSYWDDPAYLKQWEDELEAGESADTPIDLTAPLSDAERALLAAYTNDERAQLAKQLAKQSPKSVDVDAALIVYVDGKPMTYADYRKMVVMAPQEGV